MQIRDSYKVINVSKESKSITAFTSWIGQKLQLKKFVGMNSVWLAAAV